MRSPVLSPAGAGAAAGRDSKMKLCDVVAVCLVLFHTASAFPLPAGKRPPEAPAEDRSLGRRRAPFALSSDCKNRSLPAGGPPADPHVPPPAARTHPKPAWTAALPPRPAGRAALALQPFLVRGCPQLPKGPGRLVCIRHVLCCPAEKVSDFYAVGLACQ